MFTSALLRRTVLHTTTRHINTINTVCNPRLNVNNTSHITRQQIQRTTNGNNLGRSIAQSSSTQPLHITQHANITTTSRIGLAIGRESHRHSLRVQTVVNNNTNQIKVQQQILPITSITPHNDPKVRYKINPRVIHMVHNRLMSYFQRRKERFNSAHGREKKKFKKHSRREMYKTWNTENLLRVMGERRGQRGARRNAKDHQRRHFLWNFHAGVVKKGRGQHLRQRRMKKNFRERFDYDPLFRKKPDDELGPDAVYKYKPTPQHLKPIHFGIHPRPIESNLVTGNEKVADRVLPSDFMDRIFNQEGAGKSIRERFTIPVHKLHYDIEDYCRLGWKQRLIGRLFFASMPYATEPLTISNGTARRLLGSNQVWLYGAWVDRREIIDLCQAIALFTIGIPGICIARLRLESERLQSGTVSLRDGIVKNPLFGKHRIISDSDRTKRPQFELVEGAPRHPLLD